MRALDLFCGGGGACKGLQEAGFEVTGVDRQDLAGYYPAEFVQADALEYLAKQDLSEFDLIWASPPCQKYSKQSSSWRNKNRPNIIPELRALLETAGLPYIIENVMQSPISRNLMLCGKMFGLELARHRKFEIKGFTVPQPPHVYPHAGRVITVSGSTGGSSTRDGGSRYGTVEDWRRAMGIDWLPARLLKEAVPPAYAHYIVSHYKKGG